MFVISFRTGFLFFRSLSQFAAVMRFFEDLNAFTPKLLSFAKNTNFSSTSQLVIGASRTLNKQKAKSPVENKKVLWSNTLRQRLNIKMPDKSFQLLATELSLVTPLMRTVFYCTGCRHQLPFLMAASVCSQVKKCNSIMNQPHQFVFCCYHKSLIYKPDFVWHSLPQEFVDKGRNVDSARSINEQIFEPEKLKREIRMLGFSFRPKMLGNFSKQPTNEARHH